MAKKKLSAEEYELMLARNKIPNSYQYELHSYNASIEPYYFWLVDFVGKGMSIEKIGEEMGASVVSQFFGDMIQRKQFMERRGVEILGSINTVVKSIINLLYDLRELDRRLDIYKDLDTEKESDKDFAVITLKRVWMDEVDIKRGGGSINSLSANKGFEFVTLRDAFLSTKTKNEIEGLDLNDRVKRILKDRHNEYDKWVIQSRKELEQRRRIELSYLKSQVESLRLYSIWARPYLKAAQMLQFKETDFKDPQLINAFDQNYITIKLRATRKSYLEDFYKKGPMGAPVSASPSPLISKRKKEALTAARGPYVVDVVEMTFTYRARPSVVSSTATSKGYANFGMINIKFDGYVFRPDEYELLKKQEESEAFDFIEGLTTESLSALKEDLEKYVDELDGIEKDKKKKKEKIPLLNALFGISSGSGSMLPSFGASRLREEQAKKLAVEGMMNKLFTIYDVFKKAHQLKSFPYPPEFDVDLFKQY